MCNRYVPPKRVKVKLREQLYEAEFRFEDVRPTDPAPILLADGLREMRWGWRVPWDKKPLTNAKSETLKELKIYKDHLGQRCLILTEGFFEKGIHFTKSNRRLFAMAGLWRKEKEGEKFTMLTTTPNETIAPYHNRMPFLLQPEQFDEWLGEKWETVLTNPDKSPLEKVMKQPELF